MNKSWKKCVNLGKTWSWRGSKLWHHNASSAVTVPQKSNLFQGWFVGVIYADQNRSRAVKVALEGLLAVLQPDSVALNIGAGGTQYRDVVNLEIADGPSVDIIGHGYDLPFHNGTVDLVIMQEVLEHIPDFLFLIQEIRRVLKPGGVFFCQVPFQIGFHPGPCDYWRFTRQGLEYMFKLPEWELKQISISLGHGSGFYRIAVEFVAVTASCFCSRSYLLMKALAALSLYPLKFFDLVTRRSSEKDRIPGGYFCIVMKPQTN